MKLRPRTREEAFRAIQALKDPGQEAYLVDSFGGPIIRITNTQGVRWQPGNVITCPEQLEVKQYQIIA